MQGLTWVIEPLREHRHTMAEAVGVVPIVGQMLLNRGFVNPAKAKEFLEPSLGQLLDPALIPGMARAAARLVEAVQGQEKIAIFGDYDCDGVTATATLYHALKFFGAEVVTYLPHRQLEGYGLNDDAVRLLVADGAKLIVTVDCGITAIEPARVAQSLGVDLIITDHHEWQSELPKAHALVHPRLPGSGYLNKDLCGAGVAFKLAWQLGKLMAGGERVSPEYARHLQELLAFTAIGTIADVVPLIGENRAIAVFGLKQLPLSRFLGIQALLASAGFRDNIDGYAVGFSLAPRLNAAGRMGHAAEALKMFTTATDAEAAEIAKELETKNKARQATEKAIVVEALAQADQYVGAAAMVLTAKDWHAGIVGIVASRVIDVHYCPTLVLVETDGEAHGSARSVEGFNLSLALKSCEDLLIRWGGHAMAAGLKLKLENVPAFRERLVAYVQKHCPPALLKRKLEIDAVVSLGDITQKLVLDMKRLGPFGGGNRRPLLAIKNAVLRDPKTMGKDSKHLMFYAHQGEHQLKCVAWGQGELAHLLPTDIEVDLCVEPEINEYKGQTSVQLMCRDIIPVSALPSDSI